MQLSIYLSIYNFDNFRPLTNVEQIKTDLASFNCFCPNHLLFFIHSFSFFLYLKFYEV